MARCGIAAALILLLGHGSASASGCYGGGVAAYPVYAAPWAYPPCYTAPTYAVVVPQPVPRVPLAVPTPAPPSQTSEPPKAAPAQPNPRPLRSSGEEQRGPQVTEARSLKEPRAGSPGQARVGFWNLSGKDVTLTVDGKTQTLPRDRAVTLQLGRQFVWQADQRPPRTERVPDDQPGHEIVIRAER